MSALRTVCTVFRAQGGLNRLSELELAGLHALDEGRPLLPGEAQSWVIGLLRVADQVGVAVYLCHFDAGTIRALAALPPRGHADAIHGLPFGLLTRARPSVTREGHGL